METTNKDLEFNKKIEKIEAESLGEELDEITPIVKDPNSEMIESPESINSENIEMSTCTCTGGCGSNYSYGTCVCTGGCGSNYRR